MWLFDKMTQILIFFLIEICFRHYSSIARAIKWNETFEKSTLKKCLNLWVFVSYIDGHFILLLYVRAERGAAWRHGRDELDEAAAQQLKNRLSDDLTKKNEVSAY